ncbi:MAG TPA: anthranilate synthase component I family protein [Polyangiaceae bacterium]|nr:anthranilate synthase component I family protein [Polyangiaceae bacterium]
MSLRALVVDVPPRPFEVARALSGEPGFSFLWTAPGNGPSFVACRPSATCAALDPEDALLPDPEKGPLGDVPRWIGLLPYECRRSLERPRGSAARDARPEPWFSEPVWHRHGAVVRVAEDVRVVGDDPAAVRDLARLVRRRAEPRETASVVAVPDVAADDAHAARIRCALELILDGEIYQVNLARRFDFRVTGGTLSLLGRLAGSARAPFAAAWESDGRAVVSSSPELFLDVSPRGRLLTLPIKGTRPRGIDASEDRRLARELDADPKERAELAMVVDVERNDLGRVAVTGSVRVAGVPVVETHGPVHHRVARVAARLRPGTTRTALLEAMLPSGSVTGAPKIRAMEVIRDLEPSRRGLYTGAIGYLSHAGGLRLSMAIRVLQIRGGEGRYFSGGGIVLGSDPAREVLETRWKAAQVLALLGGAGS